MYPLPQSRVWRTRRLALQPLAAVVIGALGLPAQAANEFTGLGFLGTGTSSIAYGISADGSVVVGDIVNGSNFEAFRWTGGVMTGALGSVGTGTSSHAYAVSENGSVVVGGNYTGGKWVASIWTGGVMTGLGILYGGTGSYAYGVSADGSVVAGATYSGSNWEAFRWTQAGGMTGLGFIHWWGYGSSAAQGISADGSVVVGGDYKSDYNWQAFRWTQAGGMTGLGFLPGGNHSYANGVSADGSVVVGESHNGSNLEAFRWTQADGMTGLGFLGTGTTSYAYGASADGGVVVGKSHNGSNYEAFRWTLATGMASVAGWLAGGGVTVPAGWGLYEAKGVSGNGNVVVGNATDPDGKTQAWLARVGPASGLITDIPAFNATLIEAGGRAVQAGAGLPNLALFGAHHRSLLDSGLARSADGACAWATADAARNQQTDTRMELAEVGACKDIGSARLGVGVGTARARQDWSLGGGAKYDGQYLIAEAANAFWGGMEGSLTGYYGRFDAQLNRHYLNGANVDTSTGKPDATSTALRARFDWKDAAKLGQFSLSPYAAYTWLETKLDAYTETGGGFPAQFAAATWRTNDLRVGAAAKTALSAATDLRLGLEAVHRLDDSTNGVSGQVVDLWGFSLPGESVRQTWARATADVDHRLSHTTMLTFGANAATSGGDTTWGMTAGLRASF